MYTSTYRYFPVNFFFIKVKQLVGNLIKIYNVGSGKKNFY